jgi:hypothetical protein
MANINVARLHITLLGGKTTKAKTKHPSMEKAICKNKLNLGGERMKRFLVKDLQSIFQRNDPLNR